MTGQSRSLELHCAVVASAGDAADDRRDDGNPRVVRRLIEPNSSFSATRVIQQSDKRGAGTSPAPCGSGRGFSYFGQEAQTEHMPALSTGRGDCRMPAYTGFMTASGGGPK